MDNFMSVPLNIFIVLMHLYFCGTNIYFSIKHRCVTPLYRIPIWIFDCVLDETLKPFYLGSSKNKMSGIVRQ